MFPVLRPEFAVERADRYYVPGLRAPHRHRRRHYCTVEAAKEAMRVNRALKTRRYKAFFERQSLYLRVLRAPIAETFIKEAT